MTKNPPILMSIAGSDSAAGAGVQADLKTCAAHNVYGTTILTSITAQNTTDVSLVYPLPAHVVRAQFDAVMSDMAIDVIKIGILGSSEIIEELADTISALGEDKPFLVLDPVLGSSSGTRFLTSEGVTALKTRLLPLCDVVCPNIEEAERLLEINIKTRDDMEKAVHLMVEEKMGAAIIITGGEGLEQDCADLLFDGKKMSWFEGGRIETPNSHGTGCTFSTSLACHIAKGSTLIEAVEGAKNFTAECLQAGKDLKLGKGRGPLLHGLIK